jgi:hypothetical protein
MAGLDDGGQCPLDGGVALTASGSNDIIERNVVANVSPEEVS